MSKGGSSLLNDEQMSNWLGVDHQPVKNFELWATPDIDYKFYFQTGWKDKLVTSIASLGIQKKSICFLCTEGYVEVE